VEQHFSAEVGYGVNILELYENLERHKLEHVITQRKENGLILMAYDTLHNKNDTY
jgi:hypothetical protein